MVDIDAVKRRFESLLPAVDERVRRLIAAAESLAIDYGGISIVSRATGVSRRAIARGIVELDKPPVPSDAAAGHQSKYQPTNYHPIRQLQLGKFDGTHWIPLGDLV